MEKEVAVIVSNYNCKGCLKDCLDSLLAQSYKNFKIYLLDNASSDGSVNFAFKLFPSVKILAMEKNYGFAEGYNKAIDQVNSEYIALLNSDTKAAFDWLENLVCAIENEKDIAIVGSKIYFFDQPQIINSAGQKITLAGLGFDIGFGLKDQEKFNSKRLTGSVCGASFLVKREVFKKLGGFDKDYFLFCEDTDFCWRAWLNGYRVLYEPASKIFHKFGAGTGKRETPLRVFYSQRNAMITCIKNLGALRLFLSLAVITFYTLARIIVYLLTLKPKNIWALLAANASFLLMLNKTISKRRVVQNQRKVTDKFLLQNGLIASLSECFREYLRIKGLAVNL